MSDRFGFARSRWAAIGAAVAVTLGAGAGLGLVSAAGSPPSSFVSITPERILDTRPGVDIGLSGPFVSADGRDLQVTGEVPTASVPKVVVPAGATAVSLNVTVVEPEAAGFVSVRPSGTPGAPETSNLNFEAGAIVPNAVNVAVSAGGAIELTYDAFGAVGPTANLLVDVLGYFVEGSGVPGPEGPQGPKGDKGDKGDPGDPAPTNLLPIAMARVTSGGSITSGFNVESVTYNAALGQYNIVFEDRLHNSNMVTIVQSQLSGCEQDVTTTTFSSTSLHVVFYDDTADGRRQCPFSFVTYEP